MVMRVGAQIFTTQGLANPIPLVIESSDIHGGCTSSATQTCGAILDIDPSFIDAAAGDLHLQAGSAMRDMGDIALLPLDILDLDQDTDVAEPLPFDHDGNDRVAGVEVDIGAYELP